jgi:hypothetical protein
VLPVVLFVDADLLEDEHPATNMAAATAMIAAP